jgi:2-hydroxycyclohexanecarboxyl-CoA dehydrogenase
VTAMSNAEASNAEPSNSETPHEQGAQSLNLLDLRGRTALVTGAGQGIGAQSARYLAAHGAKVVVNDFVGDRAQAVAAEINAAGGAAIAAQGDVTDFEVLAEIVAAASKQLGVVDVLVNNAGNAGADPSKVSGQPFWKTNPADWEPFIGVNLYGVLNACRAVIPAMIEAGNGGRLITIISDAGRVGEAGLEAYSAAKAGAAGLMRALAQSLGRYDITSNCIAIGATRTPAIERALANEELVKKILRKYPLHRVGEPSDIAAMVTFLASPSSSWITGQTYPVNGGFSVSQ